MDGRRKIEVFGDWHIGETVEAADTLYEIHGNIVLETNGVWKLSNSEVRVMCNFSREFEMRWNGGTFITTNCTVGGIKVDNRLRASNFALKDGRWDGVDTTVQNTYGITFHWNGDFRGVLRGKRFNAGPNPDSIIISGGADIVLEDSTFPLSLGLHTEQGGKVNLDLPCGEALTRTFDKSTLCGAEPFRAELKNVTVPHWFVFVRNIWPNNPKSEITIDRCENLMLSLLGHNVTGAVSLSPDLSSDVRMGSVKVMKGKGPVNLRMYGGLYFSGKENDAKITGPAKIAELMLWGGKVQVAGNNSKDIFLGCTTLDVHGTGVLEIDHAVLGREQGNGQVIIKDEGKIMANHVDLGSLIVKTEGNGTIEFRDFEKKAEVKTKENGGKIVFKEPREVVTVSSDWKIADQQSFVNKHLVVDGNLTFEKGGELELDDCILEIKGEYSRHRQIYWKGGKLITRNSTVGGGVHDGVYANTIFNLNDGEWDAVDTTVQYSYGITFSQETVGKFRATRLRQGPSPDSVIVSGKADVVLTDSQFVVGLALYCLKGGEYALDLPVNRRFSAKYDSSNLPADYSLELNNHLVPSQWFVFFRRIEPGKPECVVTLNDCPNFLPHLLGHNIAGDVQLGFDFKQPLKIANLTIKRGDQFYPWAYQWGTYFTGEKTDAHIKGPAVIGEHMQWAGNVKMQDMTVTCTTLDLHNEAKLQLQDVRLARPLDWVDDGSTGEFHVRNNAVATGTNVDLGRLVLHTSNSGAIDFTNVTSSIGPQKIREEGGEINLGGFQPLEQ
ncbi:hypothetical protein [Pontiella desulfatans]|uniref:hypothetical protein n=1 Tax=Pontiella desulfatans TaxID=2750659 RepID=UPI00109CC6E3|nr:hypothetical protein [Pontiella desulfatans]